MAFSHYYRVDNVFPRAMTIECSNIWNSEKMQTIRKHHLEGKVSELPFCSKCELFYTSRAAALLIDRDNGKNIVIAGTIASSDSKKTIDFLTTKFNYK